MNKEKKFTS